MRAIGSVLVASALFALADPAQAQVTSKKALTLDGAKGIAAAAAAEAKRGSEGGSIAIVDDGGNLLYLEPARGSSPSR